MSNGSKTCKILFPIHTNEKWLGGLNYYKNLFHAVSFCNDNIEIYIPDNNAQILFNFSKKAEIKKDFKYRLAKIKSFLCFKKFDKNLYFKENFHKFDLISHTDSPMPDLKSITWIPDFQHLYLPELFSKEELKIRDLNFENYAKNSNAVILSSKDAKDDFIKLFPQYANKARVLNFVSYIDPGIYKITDSISDKIKQKFNLPEKYFYTPNQFWQHKNHITLFKAIDLLKKQGIDVHLILSGCMEDYRNQKHIDKIRAFVLDNGLENNIHFLGIIDLDEVYYLMRNCVSIINPSLFEGWSTTVEEAKSLGKNIILSDLNVHKEQNPPCAQFFERKNYKMLAEILNKTWAERESEPDFELEEAARKTMNQRMIDFGKQYIEIVKELL